MRSHKEQTETQKETTRWYMQCRDCLATVVVERAFYGGATCDACGGHMSHLGRVLRDNYVRDEHRPPCDGRCTNATGPSCDCKCGGKNHGSKRVVSYVIIEGKVRVHTPHPAEAIKRATEWREGVKITRDHAELLARQHRYYESERVRMLIYNANNLKTHRNRMRRLSEAMEVK